MNQNLERCALYRRVSTNKQDDSLELQERRVLDYARFKLLETCDGLTFSDPDTSGSIPMRERQGGRALMNRLERGDIKHVVVAKLDRLGRNVRDGMAVLEFLKEKNIVLHITDLGGESISTQGHIGKLILTLMFAFAEWELGEIRDRTTKVMTHKFNLGELTGNVPYGYNLQYTFANGYTDISDVALSPTDLIAIAPLGVACTGKKLLDNPAEQHLIRQMNTFRRSGWTLARIADYLNADGHRTKTGRPWSCGSVDSVLKSRHTQRLLAQTPAAEATP